MPLRLKLTIIFLMVSIIPALFFSVLTFTDYKNSIEASRIWALQDVVTLKANKIEAIFAALKNNIEIAQSFWNIKENLPIMTGLGQDTANPRFLAAKKMLDGQLQPIQRILDLDDILLVGPDGKVVYLSNESYAQKQFLNPLPDPQQRSFLEGKSKIYITDMYANTAKSGELGNMLISAPILDSKGAFIGVIAFDVNMISIYDIIQERTGLGNTGQALIVKKTGGEITYLNHLEFTANPALSQTKVSERNIDLPAREAMKGKNGSGLLTDYRGKKVIAAWSYMPSLGWGIVAKIDAQEAFADVDSLRNFILIVLAIIFLAVSTVAFYVSKTISDPINNLAKVTRIIGSGNLDHRVGMYTKDEIGQLALAFDSMAEHLKDLQDKVVRSEKLAVVGKLASSVAHELRNPLGVMKNATYYLNMLDLGADNPEFKENMDIINQEIGHSDRIITDLLEFSRAKEPVFRPENINLIIKETLDRVRRSPNIEFVLELKDDLPPVEVDALQMHQVFYNITKNALEAMDKGGKLRIKTGLDGAFVEVLFSDTGPGISKENMAKIFEPLFSTKTKGTGLGLCVCSSIVESHNGKIEVDSKVGQGTTFKVKLPIKRG